MDTVLIVLISISSFVLGIVVAYVLTRSHAAEEGELEQKENVQDNTITKTKKSERDQNKNVANIELKKKELEKTATALKNVLVELALSVSNVDGVASKSNSTLGKVRDTVSKLDLTEGLEACQNMLVKEVDAVLKTNNSLRNELKSAQDELSYQNRVIERLHTKATTDSLTQMKNRATFDEFLSNAIDNFNNTNEPLSLIIADIDYFKKINDNYGHVAGDRVLEAVAVKLKMTLRSVDFISRYGGEEFGVVLLKTTLNNAKVVAENMRHAIETTVFHVDDKKLRITISFGCAEIIKGDTISSLIKRADKQLYQAKSAGRNIVFPRDEE